MFKSYVSYFIIMQTPLVDFYKPACNKGRRSVFMVKQLKLTTSSRVTSFTVTYLPLGGTERFALRLNVACQSMQLTFTAIVTEQLPFQLFVKFVQTPTCCKQINSNISISLTFAYQFKGCTSLILS